jgi:putative two-component system response regulator
MNSTHTLLIVDDQPENLAVLGDLLEPHYRVIAATSGRRALQLAASESPPDLILLDVTMPEMDGYAVLTRLASRTRPRAPSRWSSSPRATPNSTRSTAWKLGAADYITKPIRPAIVLARVLTQLENKQARVLLQDNQNAHGWPPRSTGACTTTS